MPGLRERPDRRVCHSGGDGRDGLRVGALEIGEAGSRVAEVRAGLPGRRPTLGLVLVLAIAAPAPALHADRVELKNGQVFDDVVAIESESHVRIRLEGGEMRLSRSQVALVERTDSPYARFLAQKQALESSFETRPSQWLDLARFAQRNGLKQSAREAALVAAELDPALPGIEALLRPLGYVQDQESGSWEPRKLVMARRGLVEHRGGWVPVEQRNADLARERDEEERRRERALAERRAAALESVAAAVVRAVEPRPTATAVVIFPTIASFPVPWLFVPNAPSPTQPNAPLRPERPADLDRLHSAPRTDLMTRQPGSLIPGVLDLGGGGGR